MTNLNILDYADFKKLYESKLFEEADMDEIAKKINAAVSKLESSIDDSTIKSEIEKITGEDIEEIDIKLEESIDEALMTIAGAVLSAGKMVEWLGKGVSFVGKKLNTKGIENVGTWMKDGGHKYTKFIEEKLVMPALELVPAYKKLPEDQKATVAKFVLIGIIGTLAVSAGFELVSAIKDGHGFMAAIEGALVSAKGSELAHLVGEVAGDVLKGAGGALKSAGGAAKTATAVA